jgi:hypothetical protein
VRRTDGIASAAPRTGKRRQVFEPEHRAIPTGHDRMAEELFIVGNAEQDVKYTGVSYVHFGAAVIASQGG